MKEWRPDDWEDAHSAGYEFRKRKECYGDCAFCAYEAGADTMLKALRDKGVFTYGNHTPDIELCDAPQVSGYWCFIPEGE